MEGGRNKDKRREEEKHKVFVGFDSYGLFPIYVLWLNSWE
jgi:hypothetical protein